MKGIIIRFIEEKGFGFIKDENMEERFFHISQIQEKSRFLSNILDYHYTDWEDRKCYVINFNPYKNQKGISARNISLTSQIFNDKSDTLPFDATITNIEYNTATLTRLVSGIKGGSSVPFATAGGNGTFRIGYPEVIRELNFTFKRMDDIGWDTFDIRELALNINGRSKITDSFVNNLKSNLINRKTQIVRKKDGWDLIDKNLLKI